DRLLAIKKTNGRSILTEEMAISISEEKASVPWSEDLKHAWIFVIGRSFLRGQVQTVKDIALENLEMNPFLAKVLSLNDARALLEFNLYQSITRSVVTAWGSAVEDILGRVGASKFGTKMEVSGNKPDLFLERDGKQYFFQIKSGPNTMNVGMVQSLNKVIGHFEKNPSNRVILGMTYGLKENISPQIKGNLVDFENHTMIGRELWDFVSEKKDFHVDLFSSLDEASKSVIAGNFSELIKEAVERLVAEWSVRYAGRDFVEVLGTMV
ncbi:TdeIII family type II restriction endonuclease, partial [Bdellovibrionota bacterium FG-2]